MALDYSTSLSKRCDHIKIPGGEPQSTGAHISESGLYREDALNRGDFPTEELLILLKKKKGSSDKIFFSIENLKLVCIV